MMAFWGFNVLGLCEIYSFYKYLILKLVVMNNLEFFIICFKIKIILIENCSKFKTNIELINC